MLQQVSNSIWQCRDSLVMPGGIGFPIRMTVIRLTDGRLVLHSPIRISDELAGALNGLGTVAFVIAPNCFHHLYVNDCLGRYPEAQLFIAPGLEKKRPDLNLHQRLADDSTAPWVSELKPFLVPGMPMVNEVVFYHARDRVLIVTDLIFNVYQAPNLRTKLMLILVDAWRKPSFDRLVRWMIKDKAAVTARVKQLLELDVTHLIMAHGEIISKDTNAILRTCFSKLPGIA